jgi:hypothetical protein
VTPAAQYVPAVEHATCVAAVAQNDPSAHVPAAEVPAGQ